MQTAGIRARDEARRATWLVSLLSLLAVALAVGVSGWLARSVLLPVRELSAGVEALRRGDFARRVSTSAADELGQLGQGFNRMAAALEEYRQSSLGELLAAKTTLEATIQALPDAVLVIAPDGTIEALNPASHAILHAQHVTRPHRIEDLALSGEQREAIDAALAGRTSHRSRIDFGQAMLVRFEGRMHRFLPTAVPIPEFAPGRYGAVVVLADVTELARFDELRSELIGVASHELKTPLTTLRFNLMLLEEQAEPFDARQRELLAAALQGCEELGETIEELLDVTRIEAGQLRLNLCPTDLAQVARRAMQSLQARYADARVQLRLDFESGAMVVQGDSARLTTVLVNLLNNALKYSSPGDTVQVRLEPVQENGACIELSVVDQGPGIPAEYRERVFEKFFRVEHQRDGQDNGVRGTGIGLYLCREIIRAHGGTIDCGPGPGGVGSRFAIHLEPLH